MAALTWYATNNLVSVHQEMSETSPGANATSSPNVGWTVGTGSTNHSELDAGSKRASSTFTGTTVPDGTPDTTLGDCLRSTNTYRGSFANANWTVTFSVIGVTNSGAQDGRMRCRLLRGTNIDGASATEITAAQQQGGLVTNLSTTQQDSSITFNPGAFSVTDEYLFVQIAWERTGAGGMSTTDVVMRIGDTATRVVSSDFTPSFSGTASIALAPLAFDASGAESFSGTSTVALAPLALDAAGGETFTGTATEALAPLAFAAEGTHTEGGSFSGDASVALAPLAHSSVGTETFSGSTSVALAPIAHASEGTYTPVPISGTSSVAVAPLALDGAGSETFTGPAAVALAPLASDGAGTYTPLAITGTSDVALAPIAFALVGAEAFSGATAFALAPLAIAGEGNYTNDKIGSVTFALAPLAFESAGTYTPLPIAGTSTLAVSPLALSAASELAFSSTASVALPALAYSLAGSLSFSGAASVAVPALAFEGAGALAFAGNVGSVVFALSPLGLAASNGALPPSGSNRYVTITTPQSQARITITRITRY